MNGVLPAIQRAIDALRDHPDRKALVSRIQQADPYQDKRFVPVIAGWVRDHKATPEEHKEDVVLFKGLYKRLKGLRVPATNKKRTATVRALLSKRPEDFPHYADLQAWNRKTSAILDPNRDLSDEGLPVEVRYEGYTMYRIDMKKHLRIPLVKNAMSWCVTKGAFGQYGGPPYYPIVRDHDRSPFCMVVPAFFDEDPDQAVRNSQNDDRLSPRDLGLIRPLLQHALPLDKYVHPYIKGIHRVRTGLPENPSAKEALDIIREYVIEPGEWDEGFLAISKDPREACLYARDVLRGPWKQGEGAVSQSPRYALEYARDVIRGPWPAGEPAIARDATQALEYAISVIRGPWAPSERAISKSPQMSLWYARNIIKGPWPKGERAISRDADAAYNYASRILKSPWPAGERAIGRSPMRAVEYARYVLKGSFPEGEKAIARDPSLIWQYVCEIASGPFPHGEHMIAENPSLSYRYAYHVLKGPWPPGEAVISRNAEWSYLYARDVVKGPFTKGEAAINKNSRWKRWYERLLTKTKEDKERLKRVF